MKEKYLKFYKNFQDAFVGAAENCRIDDLKELLSLPEVNIDALDSTFGKTALGAASCAGSKKTVAKFAYWGQCLPEVFEQLISAGATNPECGFRNIHLA